MARLTYELKVTVDYGWLKWRVLAGRIIDYTKLYKVFPSLLCLRVVTAYSEGKEFFKVTLNDIIVG